MFEQARVVAERLVNESPDDAPRRAMLGQILAALGQKDAAIAEGKRAAELLPESEDAFGGPSITAALAQIYVWTGDYDQAFRLLDHLLERQTASPFRLSSSIPLGTRCAKTRAFRL